MLFYVTNAPCPEGTHACVPKRHAVPDLDGHSGVQARTMKKELSLSR